MRSKKFWLILIVVLAVVVLLAFLLLRSARPQTMRHALTGYVLEVTPEVSRITVRNADMPGIMTSMVMDYRVKDAAAIAGIKAGDIIQATMIMDGTQSLEDIKVIGKH
jgi:Cu/Ag efflux protein CusF